MKVSCLLILLWSQFLHANDFNTIHRGNGAEPDALHIHQAQGLNSHNILMDMYEGLMTFDAQGQSQYGVAINHQVNAAFTEWQFELRPTAKWSDGHAVTANDFIAAWQLAVAPATAAPYRALFDNMLKDGQLNVHSNHPHHLHIQLNHADTGLLNKLVLPIFYPLPQQQTESKISNGAYALVDWVVQEKITLQRNRYFHAADEVKTEQVVYWVTDNQNSELLRFRAGELDITETIPDNQIDWLRQHLADELRIAPYYGTFFLGLNLNDRHLGNRYLRKALNLAIDRQILVDKVLKSGQLAATQIVPPATTQQRPESATHFDPTQAKALLKQSGFKPAVERLEILYNNSDNQKKVALAIAAMWRQNLGIRTRLRNQEWKVFVNTRQGPNKQVFRSGWIADYHDPLNFLNLFTTDSHFNFYGFSNTSYDHLLQQLNTRPETRDDLLAEAEQTLARELPVIPLYHYVSRHLVSTTIIGFTDNAMDRHLSRYLHKKTAP